jgi:hypothetical protein
MDWIFEHLNIIIVVAGAIAYWINQRAREKAGEEADYDGDGIPENRPDPRDQTRELTPASRGGADIDQDERNRRIREEIQRKIAERRNQGEPPPLSGPPRLDPFRPVFQEDAAPLPAPAPVLPSPMPAPAPVTAYDDSAAIERQRRLAEQLEHLEEQRRAARRVAQSAFDSTEQQAATMQTEKAAGVGARRLSAELRDPRSLRRAMVLREILDAPVALR